MIIMRILDRYLVQKIAVTVLYTLFGLVIFSLIIRITDELGQVGHGGYTVSYAILYSTAFALPDFNTFFPMAGLLGAMIALGQLASHRELIIIQSVGVSKLRILLGLLWFIIPFGLANLALQQWVSPVVTNYAINMKAQLVNGGGFFANNQSVWARSDGEFIYADVDAKYALDGVLILKFSPMQHNELENIVIGHHATWDKLTHRWVLDRATVFNFKYDKETPIVTTNLKPTQNTSDNSRMTPSKQPAVATSKSNFPLNGQVIAQLLQQQLNQKSIDNSEILQQIQEQVSELTRFNVELYANYQWDSNLTPDKLSLVNQDTSNFSITELYNYINFLEQSEQNANSFKYLLWSKIFSILSFFVMMFLATASIFGNMRSASMMLKVFFAVILGLVFHVLNNTVGPFLLNFNLPVWLAALTPSIVFTLFGIYLYQRKQ